MGGVKWCFGAVAKAFPVRHRSLPASQRSPATEPPKSLPLLPASDEISPMPDEVETPASTARRQRRLVWLACSPFLLIGFAVLIVYLALNWSATCLWEATDTMLKAKQNTLAFSSQGPSDVPDDENFFGTAIWKASAEGKARHHTSALITGEPWPLDALDGAYTYSPEQAIQTGVMDGIEWNAEDEWARFMESLKWGPRPPKFIPDRGTAGDRIAATFSPLDAALHDIESGVDRPYSQFIPSWRRRTESCPPLHVLDVTTYDAWTLIGVLCGRAQLAVHQENKLRALADLRLSVRILEAMIQEPPLGVRLCAKATNRILEVSWSLLKSKKLTEAELRQLVELLGSIQLDQAMLREYRATSTILTTLFDSGLAERGIKGGARALEDLWRPEDKSISEWQPDGLRAYEVPGRHLQGLNRDALVLGTKAVALDMLLINVITPLEKHGIDGLREWMSERYYPTSHSKLTLLTFGTFSAGLSWNLYTEIRPVFWSEAHLRQARIACALERYLLKHGIYPADLQTLVPEFLVGLPLDPIDGRPMRYRIINSRYQVWSVGYDSEDDRGRVVREWAHSSPPSMRTSDPDGDWVWSYEPLVPSTTK